MRFPPAVRPLLPVAIAIACSAGQLAAQGTADLQARLQARIAQSGATVGLYFRDLVSGDSVTLGADVRFHAASTMKVPVMIQVFREVDAGRLRLDQSLPVGDSFRSIADSSTYTLNRADDSDSSLYRQVGRTAKVRDLVELMIEVSSNLAANILITRVGPANVRASMREIGADSMIVMRGVEDGPAFRAGMNNTTTARGFGVALGAIVDGRAASAASCGEMVRILQRQRFRDGIPAGLPRRMRVAHKTGWITGVHHDGGVVYWRDRPRYVLVVLTRGLAQKEDSARLIAELATMVNAHAVPESVAPEGR